MLSTAPPTCNPLTQILHAGICKECSTDTQLATTTALVCNSQTDIRFFTYTVAHDTTKTDDELNFHGILTLDNFDVNTNLISDFQTWLQTNIVLTPNISGNSPTISFNVIDPNRTPTGDKKINLPFKIQLTTALTSTQTIVITFNSYSLV
jgi:hypothetical protein